MNRLTLAARNMLVQTPEVRALVADGRLGSGLTWTDGWIFSDYPYATIEKHSYKSLVVLSDGGMWKPPSEYNSSEYRVLTMDIWASPTRNADGSPVRPDADFLIEDVAKVMKIYLRPVDPGVPGNASLDPSLPYLGHPGDTRMWGTQEEIAARTGVLVMSSDHIFGPSFFDVDGGNGARMGRYRFGVHTA